MGMIEPMIEEFSHEAATTKKILERIPEDKLDWKPREKSMSFGHLGSHLAESLAWFIPSLEKGEMDFDPEGYQPWIASSKAEILEAWDKNLAGAIDCMKSQTDETLMGMWTMKMAGKEVFSMPRVALLRNFLISHMIHHRGQLSVYLRLNDVPVPQVYGPTADETEMNFPEE